LGYIGIARETLLHTLCPKSVHFTGTSGENGGRWGIEAIRICLILLAISYSSEILHLQKNSDPNPSLSAKLLKVLSYQ